MFKNLPLASRVHEGLACVRACQRLFRMRLSLRRWRSLGRAKCFLLLTWLSMSNFDVVEKVFFYLFSFFLFIYMCFTSWHMHWLYPPLSLFFIVLLFIIIKSASPDTNQNKNMLKKIHTFLTRCLFLLSFAQWKNTQNPQHVHSHENAIDAFGKLSAPRRHTWTISKPLWMYVYNKTPP